MQSEHYCSFLNCQTGLGWQPSSIWCDVGGAPAGTDRSGVFQFLRCSISFTVPWSIPWILLVLFCQRHWKSMEIWWKLMPFVPPVQDVGQPSEVEVVTLPPVMDFTTSLFHAVQKGDVIWLKKWLAWLGFDLAQQILVISLGTSPSLTHFVLVSECTYPTDPNSLMSEVHRQACWGSWG